MCSYTAVEMLNGCVSSLTLAVLLLGVAAIYLEGALAQCHCAQRAGKH